MTAIDCRERGLGELFAEGDRACAGGDLEALNTIAEHVAEHLAEPLHCEVVELVQRCRSRDGAAAAWTALKERFGTSP